jgi:hypothetical protein
MVAKVIGNRGEYLGGNVGLGRAAVPDGTLNWVVAIGKVGDVAYINAAGLNAHPTKLSYFCQGTGATLQFTLSPEKAACDEDPNVQDMVVWGNSVTPTNDIQAIVDANKVPIGFTAIKVTFTGTGQVMIAGR